MIFDECSLLVCISSHEPSVRFCPPCLFVLGRVRVALVSIQPGSALYSKAGREGHPPTLPTPSTAGPRTEAVGLWAWLAAEVVIQWEVFQACREQSPALPCPVQPSCISWESPVEGGTPEVVCPVSSYEHEHLWGLLTPTCKPFWAPRGPLFPDTSLWNSNMSLYHCVRSICSGWTRRASSFHQEQATVTFSTYREVGGKELQHTVYGTTTLQHQRPGHRTSRESETCRTVQVKRVLSRSLVRPPAQGMAR